MLVYLAVDRRVELKHQTRGCRHSYKLFTSKKFIQPVNVNRGFVGDTSIFKLPCVHELISLHFFFLEYLSAFFLDIDECTKPEVHQCEQVCNNTAGR